MRTSGVNVAERVEHRECGTEMTHEFPLFSDGPKFERSWTCIFAGEVDVDMDPETFTASWECPICGTAHDVSGEVFP